MSWLHVQPTRPGPGTCGPPHMQGNGAGDKMCTQCGWTPHVCKVLQHVASAEAVLGSSHIPVRLQVGVAELGASKSKPPPLSQDH